MHVSKIRRKLGDSDAEDYIKTIRGSGYIFAIARPKKNEKSVTR
jgi:DNA-binding response OmpR family regulator